MSTFLPLTAATVSAASLALAAASSTAPAAHADPHPASAPASGSGLLAEPQPAGYRTYAAVGSNTMEDVWNGLTNGAGAVLPQVASYDAFPLDSSIRTKASGPSFLRPSGSVDGVKALSASLTNGSWYGVNINNQVDFARSSSGPVAGSGLTYIPFARDAVSVAVRTSLGPVKLSATQIRDIYTCKVRTIKVGNQTITVNPKLPQAASGTRKFFLTVLGVTPGSCVSLLDKPDNDGAVIPNAGDVMPFSAAQYIAQKNRVITDTTTGLQLASIDGRKAARIDPATGQWVPGGLYGSAVDFPRAGGFERDTYNVLGRSKLGTPLEAALVTAAKSTAVLKKYGFKRLGYAGNPSYYLSGAYQY